MEVPKSYFLNYINKKLDCECEDESDSDDSQVDQMFDKKL